MESGLGVLLEESAAGDAFGMSRSSRREMGGVGEESGMEFVSFNYLGTMPASFWFLVVVLLRSSVFVVR